MWEAIFKSNVTVFDWSQSEVLLILIHFSAYKFSSISPSVKFVKFQDQSHSLYVGTLLACQNIHNIQKHHISFLIYSFIASSAFVYASAMVTSTSTPGSMLMEVICLTISDGLCRSIRRLWILIWKRSQVLEPSPQGVFLVVMRRVWRGEPEGTLAQNNPLRIIVFVLTLHYFLVLFFF